MKNKDIDFQKPSYTILGYILIPIVGLFLSIIFMVGQEHHRWVVVLRHLIYGITATSGVWLGCITIVTYLWRKYPWHNNPVKHLVVEIVAISLYTILFTGSLYWLGREFKFIESRENTIRGVFGGLLITFFITSVHEAVFFYRQWKYNFSKSVQLENQHLKAKYESLKSQINPHYLFNGLNNLISIVDDNPLAVEYIQQMSTFLRYMLKSRSEELVSLAEEITMLTKYIYLHKIRFGENLVVEQQINDNIASFKLPPLTLQMLVENCIKHNVIAKNKTLHVVIRLKDERIYIENNLNPKKNVDSTGKGLENISERYRYFTNKEIIVDESNDYFKVSIPLITK